jgi:hypothetical protein
MAVPVRWALLFFVALSLGARPGAAQALPSYILTSGPRVAGPTVQRAARPAEEGDAGLAALGALVGGAAGAFVGLTVGFELGGGDEICGDDPCGFASGLIGFIAGEILGIGVGAHLGNGLRGNVGAAIGATLAATLVAVALNSMVELPSEALVVVPLAQIAAAVWAELVTSRGTH